MCHSSHTGVLAPCVLVFYIIRCWFGSLPLYTANAWTAVDRTICIHFRVNGEWCMSRVFSMAFVLICLGYCKVFP